MAKNELGKTNIWSKKKFVQKYLVQTTFGSKEVWSKKLWFTKIMVGGWVVYRYIIMPIRGPTCKILQEFKLNSKSGPSMAKCRVLCSKNMEQIIQWSPLWIIFKGKIKNHSSLARTICASRRSFFTNLTTFERRSGLQKISQLKITILKMG